MQSLSWGCRVRQVSRDSRSWRHNLIWHRARNGRWDVPMEVSMRGSRGTLKSPPRMSIPDWKEAKMRAMDLKNATCEVLGLYTLARVSGLSQSVPLRRT